ncbi:MAG: septation protein A [Deltaproteobacteria bacterium]|nr:septation protein A [Deltaproteobacteria bacterium]
MKFFFDLLPVLLFFVVYKVGGIYAATAAAIAASGAQLGWALLRRRRADPMQWVTLAIIGVFGGATLVLRDPTFIKWKPTVLYWLFAVVLFTSATVFKRNLLEAMMKGQIGLPAGVWRTLNLAWATFFAALGAANLYVAFHYAESTWVNFKAFGTTGLLLAFALAQGLFLARHVEEKGEG